MSFWNFERDAVNVQDGVLQIDGEIVTDDTWWAEGQVLARKIRQQLEQCRNVTVYINSPGGDVMGAAEIYSALREHSLGGRGRVTVKITGLAASAASIVAMAGDEILMSPAAYMMIHNPWSVRAGNAKDLRQEADILDEVTEGMLNAYQQRTGKTRDEIRALLDNETYMSAQTCIDEGFADGMLYQDDRALHTKLPQGKAARTGTRAMLRRRDYDRQAVLASIAAHQIAPAAEEEKNAPLQAAQPDDPARRAEIARRARVLAGAWESMH